MWCFLPMSGLDIDLGTFEDVFGLSLFFGVSLSSSSSSSLITYKYIEELKKVHKFYYFLKLHFILQSISFIF